MPALAIGTRLGPYEIVGNLGAGGMGEVLRARDIRLGREVAIKVLPADFRANSEWRRRFEREARAAGALNHPNILAIHDVGMQDGVPFAVSELLEGATLRERLQDGAALPMRKALDYGIQVAHGLAAAHEKGIVHRDLKPENLFVTKDGRIKILDFGLARWTERQTQLIAEDASTLPIQTEPGALLGTIDYMAPEQARGQPVDHRADLFSLGVVLYEMLTGRRPFSAGSPIETLNAILNQDPVPLTEGPPALPPALERIVRHCLEKSPQERFQSAHDVAFALESLAELPVLAGRPLRRSARWRGPALLLGAVALSLALALVVATARLLHGPPGGPLLPSFQRLTFRRGTVLAARFAPDGQTVVVGAQWDRDPVGLWTTRLDSPESRPLEGSPATLLSVSTSGEMALNLHPKFGGGWISAGTLARAPLAGGGAREILEEVEAADWSPDGTSLAIVRAVGDWVRLELPPGKVVYQVAQPAGIGDPRVSPRGDLIAFFEHPDRADDPGSVAIVDLSGRKRTLAGPFRSGQGLAWAPSGQEIWFTAGEVGGARSLRAADLSGRQRVLYQAPGMLTLHDVSRDGRALVALEHARRLMVGRGPDDAADRDLSWFDWSYPFALSSDGKVVLFGEWGQAAGSRRALYMRRLDGSPAVRLDADPTKPGPAPFSPDGRWVVIVTSPAGELALLPTGPGTARPIVPNGLGVRDFIFLGWFPDSKRILFASGARAYIEEIAGRTYRPIAARDWGSLLPDGRHMLVKNQLVPLDGGPALPIRGLEERDEVRTASEDGRYFYIERPSEAPGAIFRVDTSTGRRELWKTWTLSDPSGVVWGVGPFAIAPNGRAYVYSYRRVLSDLYLVVGLR